jgi:hypothetical protein
MPISITHIGGIAIDGWVDQLLKIYEVNFDLETFRAKVKAVRVVDVPDASFLTSLPDTDDPHDIQVRKPPYQVLVNDAVLTRPTEAEIEADFNDLWPPPPPTEDVTVDIIYNLVSTDPPITVPATEFAYTNVRWQVDNTTDPRKISAYVPIPLAALPGGITTPGVP